MFVTERLSNTSILRYPLEIGLSGGGFMGGAFRLFLFLIVASWFGCHSAFADKRVALVIGNSAYQKVARLPNPANDAAAVAAMFKAAGFETVESKLNLPANDLRKALREFGARSRDADVAVVYYAGHGIELDGTNYLIPVDATLETDADVLDETVPLDRVLFAVEPAKQLRLVILDACRDNPFARTMKRTIAARSVGRGLAKVEPTSPNTMIAFAAKAGSTASDGDSSNSPFAAALVVYLPKPGLDLRRAFGFVRDDVLKSTGNKQEPYVYGSLGGNDVPLVPAKPVATGPQADPQAAVRRDYELALQLATRDGWEAFLSQYPNGFYANLAKGQLKKIAAEETRAAAAEKARLAEQEKVRLAAEGAKHAEQARAAAAAKAAEQARLAAEKAKQIEQEKAAAAEKARLAEQEKVRLAAEKAVAEKKDQLAALPLAADKPEQSSQADLPRALQAELRRVGCNSGAVDGNWNAASQKALDLFNKHAGMKLDVKTASADALDAVKGKSARVCPLVCEFGYRADGDRCVKITCRSGYEVGDNGTCEKIEVKKPTARREEPKPKSAQSERAKADPAAARPQASGQFLCDQQGCRPVRKGCRVVQGSPSSGAVGGTNISTREQSEICN
jgi:uncharacterized caspase-like protein